MKVNSRFVTNLLASRLQYYCRALVVSWYFCQDEHRDMNGVHLISSHGIGVRSKCEIRPMYGEVQCWPLGHDLAIPNSRGLPSKQGKAGSVNQQYDIIFRRQRPSLYTAWTNFK